MRIRQSLVLPILCLVAATGSARSVKVFSRSELCPVTVRVVQTATGCLAEVDNPSVVVRGKGQCVWNLTNGDPPGSPNTYSFFDGGIRWAADPLIPGDDPDRADTRARRDFSIPVDGHLPTNPGADPRPITVVKRAGRAQSNSSHYYLPAVRTMDGLVCEATDPRIANDN